MPHGCSICNHPAAAKIDEQLVGGVPVRQIVASLPRGSAKPSDMAFSRHRRNCLTPGLVAIQARSAAAGGPTLAERLEQLYERAERILEEAERNKDGATVLAGVRELTKVVELLAKLTGQLDAAPKVQVLNVTTSPEWTDLRQAIFEALRRFPEAAIAVADALDRAPTLQLTP